MNMDVFNLLHPCPPTPNASESYLLQEAGFPDEMANTVEITGFAKQKLKNIRNCAIDRRLSRDCASNISNSSSAIAAKQIVSVGDTRR